LDLVFFSRGTRTDSATDKFRAIAREWHETAHLPAAELANTLYAQDLDAIVDMGGWMDPVGLSALSTKPAPRLFKWVGGQACTTGLDVFDGFLTDRHQSPPCTADLYSEPLVELDSGYVSYTPPDYMPMAVAGRPRSGRYGVISNPAKVSSAFLRDLGIACGDIFSSGGTLWFIDRRYGYATVRDRIVRELGRADARAAVQAGRVRFAAPTSHREYLEEVSRLSQILDTAPYSGGLTTVEALSMGVECAARDGRLFSARHSLAHFRFSHGATQERLLPCGDRLRVFRATRNPRRGMRVRADHAGVAAALLRVLAPAPGDGA
jgi:predicted O-linked N-acetylglucosamine transferase (SPINDLY family)